MLREHSNLQFERVPNSGALEYLKGDLYIPHEKNIYCIEVKNYAESPLSDRIFTQKKTNNLIKWWKKLIIQAEGGNQTPLLFFKYNRSPIYVFTDLRPDVTEEYLYIRFLNCYILLAEEWLEKEKPRFLQ